MADGHGRNAWAHTSLLCALIANAFGGKGKRFKPSDFDPYARSSGRVKVNRENLSYIKSLFTGMKKKE
jgi:hypothetical protein